MIDEKSVGIANKIARFGIWEWDIQAERLTYSDEIPELYCLDNNALNQDFKSSILSVVHPEDKNLVENIFSNIGSDVLANEYEYRIINDENETRWLRVLKEKVKDSNGDNKNIICAVQDITGYKIAEEERMTNNVHKLFTRQLISAEEKERQRIAAELHDSLGQNILIIKNKALMDLQLNESSKFHNELMNDISTISSDMLNEIQSIIYNLHPVHLQKFGLTETIKSLVNNISCSFKFIVSSEIQNIDGIFSEENQVIIFRIIQECFNNIIKHSNASEAYLGLFKKLNCVNILINDNGDGFDLNSHLTPSKGNGLGLINIKHRISILDGELIIDSSKGEGTSIKIIIPTQERSL